MEASRRIFYDVIQLVSVDKWMKEVCGLNIKWFTRPQAWQQNKITNRLIDDSSMCERIISQLKLNWLIVQLISSSTRNIEHEFSSQKEFRYRAQWKHQNGISLVCLLSRLHGNSQRQGKRKSPQSFKLSHGFKPAQSFRFCFSQEKNFWLSQQQLVAELFPDEILAVLVANLAISRGSADLSCLCRDFFAVAWKFHECSFDQPNVGLSLWDDQQVSEIRDDFHEFSTDLCAKLCVPLNDDGGGLYWRLRFNNEEDFLVRSVQLLLQHSVPNQHAVHLLRLRRDSLRCLLPKGDKFVFDGIADAKVVEWHGINHRRRFLLSLSALFDQGIFNHDTLPPTAGGNFRLRQRGDVWGENWGENWFSNW